LFGGWDLAVSLLLALLPAALLAKTAKTRLRFLFFCDLTENSRTGGVHNVFGGIEQVPDGVVVTQAHRLRNMPSVWSEGAVTPTEVDGPSLELRTVLGAPPWCLGGQIEIALAYGVTVCVSTAFILFTFRAHRHCEIMPVHSQPGLAPGQAS